VTDGQWFCRIRRSVASRRRPWWRADGREDRDDREIARQDCVATARPKQLNFVQDSATILDTNGRAGAGLPDNVLFEGGGGETVRRKLITDFDLHTILRLPTGSSTRRA